MNEQLSVFRFAPLLFSFVFMACATSPARETGFLNRTLDLGGRQYQYVVYVPQTASPEPLPVILFLHGSGERGDDGFRQIEVGLGRAIRWNRDRFPAVVVFPQAPPDTRWLGDVADFAMQAVDRTIAEVRADRDRVYLTGLSLGGYGTWHLAMAHPERFAAIVPVCGGIVKPESAENVRQSPLTMGTADPYATAAEKVKHIPAWIFHGADDTVIPASESRRMVEELRRRGADVRYTEYPGVGHNSWDPAYSDPELWSWLLRQRRGRIEPALIPAPKRIELLGPGVEIEERGRCRVSSPELEPLLEVLEAEGAPLGSCSLIIDRRLAADEYEIDTADRVEVRGGSYRAVAMGTVTLQQAISGGRMPRMRISDRPSSEYRGLLIDVARKPHSIDVLKQLVILARWYKINYLQLHLTDDQLFTFPSAAYPALATPGAHYTKDELRALDRFARDRGVAIVPEIEIPGHAGQFIARMPELFAIRDRAKNRGTINMGRESVYTALDALLGEVAGVFTTSEFIHIGGDEASRAGLADDPDVQAYLVRHGLRDVEELYRHFLVRMNQIVKRHGKRMIVWEGFHRDGDVDIPRDILVMAWETMYQLPQDLLAGGYTIVNASWKPLYVANRKKWDPQTIYSWNMYRWENWVPTIPSYTPIQLEPSPRVIGGSMSSWDQPEHVELHSIRRRLAAMSERIWTPTITAAVAWSEFEHKLERANAALEGLITPIRVAATGLSHPEVRDGHDNEHLWFGDRLELRFRVPEGLAVRYSVDGSEPTPHSARYESPIVLTDSTMVKARAFRGDRAAGFTIARAYELHPIEAVVKGDFAVPLEEAWERPGIAAEFYDAVTIELKANRPGTIRYTVGRGTPSEYVGPLRITESAAVTAQLVDGDGEPVGRPWSLRLKLVPRLR